MRFPFVIKRGGASQPALGSDSLPTTPIRGDGKDYVFELSTVGSQGQPIQRLAGYFTCPTSGANATIKFYVFDENLQAWVLVGTVTAVSASTLFGVDLPSPPDRSSRGSTKSDCGSGLRLCVIAADGGAGKTGEYDFAFCPSFGRA